MDKEIKKLKIQLLLLRINKITKQKADIHEMKKIQHQISKINQLNHKHKTE